MSFSIVVAMSSNGLIGKDGDLPWHLSDDLRHFKAITMGKPIIMGRITHESIGRPLPGRENIILTRNSNYEAQGCTIIHDLASLDCRSPEVDEYMIVGGSQLYAETLGLASKLFITEVHAEIEGDIFFPDYDKGLWKELERENFQADQRNDYDYSFVVLERR